jgi:hypothetical protein
VENASSCRGSPVGFVHSVAVMEKRDALKVWTIFSPSSPLLFAAWHVSRASASHWCTPSPTILGAAFHPRSLAMFICGSFVLSPARADAQAGRIVRADLA